MKLMRTFESNGPRRSGGLRRTVASVGLAGIAVITTMTVSAGPASAMPNCPARIAYLARAQSYNDYGDELYSVAMDQWGSPAGDAFIDRALVKYAMADMWTSMAGAVC